jgi:iron complex transport system ATP-binding protein
MGALTPNDQSHIDQALQAAQAQHLADKPLGILSDGERQRLQLARILAQAAPLILMDEPLAYLDWPGRIDLLKTLTQAARQRSCGILLSLHEIDLALDHCDQLLLLDGNSAWEILPGRSETTRTRIQTVFNR